MDFEEIIEEIQNHAHSAKNQLIPLVNLVNSLCERLESGEEILKEELKEKLNFVLTTSSRSIDLLNIIMSPDKEELRDNPLNRLRLRELSLGKVAMYDDIIEKVLEYHTIAHMLAEKRITVDHSHSLKKGEVCITADKDLLRIAFLNVFENAIQNAPENGIISYGYNIIAEHHVFDIYNSGQPLLEDIRTKIIQRGYTTGKQHGTGLGLAICRDILQLHRGDVYAEPYRREGVNVLMLVSRELENAHPEMVNSDAIENKYS